MKSYCLKCRRDTENINPRVSNTSNGKTMVLSKCGMSGSKKSKSGDTSYIYKNGLYKACVNRIWLMEILKI